MSKPLTDFFRKNTIDRYKQYEKDDIGYCFSISLIFPINTLPEIKIAMQETGIEAFENKYNEAVKQGKALKADRIIIREFEDPNLEFPQEYMERRQEIPLSITSEKQPSTRSKNAALNGANEFETYKIKVDYERSIENKDREIKELQAIISQKQNEIVANEKEIEELTASLQEANDNKWALKDLPVGKFLGDAALSMLTRKPQLGQIFGIPPEAISQMLGGNESEAPAGQKAEQDERTQYYDMVLEYCSTLTDPELNLFLQIVAELHNDKSKLITINDLVEPSKHSS